jgi:5-enolpyruvylshikimate-3-phosphate synthase
VTGDQCARGDVTELPDGLAIRPRPLRARAADGPFGSYDDHRMVMAAAVLGLVLQRRVVISDSARVMGFARGGLAAASPV